MISPAEGGQEGRAFGKEERLREVVRISFAECPSESGTVGCFTGKINKPPNNSVE